MEHANQKTTPLRNYYYHYSCLRKEEYKQQQQHNDTNNVIRPSVKALPSFAQLPLLLPHSQVEHTIRLTVTILLICIIKCIRYRGLYN